MAQHELVGSQTIITFCSFVLDLQCIGNTGLSGFILASISLAVLGANKVLLPDLDFAFRQRGGI